MTDTPDDRAPRHDPAGPGRPAAPRQSAPRAPSEPSQAARAGAQAARASGEAQEKSQPGRRRRKRRKGRGAPRGDASARPDQTAAASNTPPPKPADPAPPASAPPAPTRGTEPRDGEDGGRGGKPGGRNRGRGRGRAPVYAALDLGTNNCRLLVAREDGPGFTVIDAFSRVVRLGEGLAETGEMADGAMARAAAAIRICAERLKRHRVARFRAIATEACRRAANQDAFVDRVQRETGVTLEVIAAEEEARLAVAGCAPLFDPSAERLLVFDIGGGSTELIELDLTDAPPARRRSLVSALAHPRHQNARAAEAADRVTAWASLPVGVVTLGERFDDIIDDGEKFVAMHACAVDLLRPFADEIKAIAAERGRDSPAHLARMQMLGTSGTITTLAGVHLDLERYSRRAVDGLWISTMSVDRVIERLVSMNAYQRAAIPCVGEDRATNLMSGAAILRAILRAWPTQRLRVADRGLREGMLYGLIDAARAARGKRGGRR